MFTDKGMNKEGVVHKGKELVHSHKSNETMPGAAAWMDLKIVTLSAASQTNVIWYHLHMESKKNELIYKTERASQTQITNLWLPKSQQLEMGR